MQPNLSSPNLDQQTWLNGSSEAGALNGTALQSGLDFASYDVTGLMSAADSNLLSTLLNGSSLSNDTGEPQDDVFQHFHIRLILIVAYTIVFICCFFGNLIVITVVVLHRRMRTATKFFLANLAVADLCVGVFCVYQNLLIYLAPVWSLGDFLCRMYHFIHGLSYTASILILTTISLERYVVIVHPMWKKRTITLRRLRIVVAVLWLVSAIYNCPRLLMYSTVNFPSWDNEDEYYTLCVAQRAIYNTAQFDLYNFAFLFVFPILVMTVLYTSIGLKLWRSDKVHGENSAACLRCLCRGKTKTPSRWRRVKTTFLSREHFTKDQLTREDSSETKRSQDEGFLSSDALEYDSSCDEDDEVLELDSSGRKLNRFSKGSSTKRSSLRSSGTRSITFARCDSENNSIHSKLSTVGQDSLHKSVSRTVSENKDEMNGSDEQSDVLLTNQVNLMKDNIDQLSDILESDGDEEEPKQNKQFKKNEKCKSFTYNNNQRPPSELKYGRSASQHSGLRISAIIRDSIRSTRDSLRSSTLSTLTTRDSLRSSTLSTPTTRDSLRSYASEVSTYIGTSSQRSQGEESTNGETPKRNRVKIHRTGSKVLRSRRKIIRLLLAVVVCFTVCNLPYHARKFWQSWGPTYNGTSTTSIFLTISTTLILYMNSGINPFLYAFMSASFRQSVKDVFLCRVQSWKKNTFSQFPSNRSRPTSSTSTAPLSQGSLSSNVSNV